MKKNDFLLIILVVFISLAAFLFLKVSSKDGAEAVVKVDGEVYGIYNLNKDQIIDIDGGNTLVIEDNKVYMKDATCPDGICVDHKPISKDGESIICLPHKVIVTIESDSKSDIDAVSN